jgi:hypothetical protein
MRTKTDWLPRNHEALFHQGTQTITYLNAPANRDRTGFNPGTMQGKWIAAEYQTKFNAFTTALNNWLNTAERTPLKIAVLKETEEAFRDTPPESINDLANSSFDTRSPFTLTFDETQRGLTVYFCLCWENTRGEKGPWGEIMSAVIP